MRWAGNVALGRPITNITIVGGGTAGWIAAAHLNHALQWGPTGRPDVAITLIESPNIPSVGVGEGTLPLLAHTLELLQISEPEFVLRTNATFKYGTRLENWNVDDRRQPYAFVHPFHCGSWVRGLNPGNSFRAHGVPGRENLHGREYVRLVSRSVEAIERRKAPRDVAAAPYSNKLRYAYHVDAARFAEFLSEVCQARGVQRLADDVIDVEHDERGFVSALKLAKSGTHAVELVIDCTGFRGLLINEAMSEPFVPFSDYLLNDRAIPIQVAHRDLKSIEPVTVSRALEAGWSWRIPLHSRLGTGYVYSSAFKSDEKALEELHTQLAGDHLLTEPRVLRMRVGRSRRAWVKNCVAIGLSAGFLEPLESTAIQSIDLSARWLVATMPTTDFEEPLRAKFNATIEKFYEHVRDFLALHYTLGNRDDTPYWLAVRNETKKSDAVLENLALWRHAVPDGLDVSPPGIFSSCSLQSVLFGKDFYRNTPAPTIDVVAGDVWRRYCLEWEGIKDALLDSLPDHLELIEAMRAAAQIGDTVGRPPETQMLAVSETPRPGAA